MPQLLFPRSIIALFVANALNIALNGLFLLQLGIYVGVLAESDPLFLRVIVYLFSIVDIFHTGVRLRFIHHILKILVLIPRAA